MTDIITRINFLPLEIRNKVISYSYSPQPKELCQDIRSYYGTYTTALTHYNRLTQRGVFGVPDPEDIDNSPISWLSNDICRYLNNDIPTMHGYNNFYLGVYQRLYNNKIKSTHDMVSFVTRLDEKLESFSIGTRDITQYIQMTIALLKPTERDNLMSFIYSITPI